MKSYQLAIAKPPMRNTVGGVPKEISRICWHFIGRGGTITCVVTGRRQCSFLPEGRLEIPNCIYKFQGEKKDIKKLNSLLMDMKYKPIVLQLTVKHFYLPLPFM